MSNRGARRSPPTVQSTTERRARIEAARVLKLGARASSEPDSTDRALTIREKIIRWLEEKL